MIAFLSFKNQQCRLAKQLQEFNPETEGNNTEWIIQVLLITEPYNDCVCECVCVCGGGRRGVIYIAAPANNYS